MKLHLGCGNRYIPGFVNIDVQKLDTVDITADAVRTLVLIKATQVAKSPRSMTLHLFNNYLTINLPMIS